MGVYLKELEGKEILVTGAAGFIGAALTGRLLKEIPGVRVTGVDSLNDYYDLSLKERRLARLQEAASPGAFRFVRMDVSDKEAVSKLFEETPFDIVFHLAGQAGVRYSIDRPDTYIASNIVGSFNILEACRRSLDEGAGGVSHLIYASSSSVYGANTKVPYSTDDRTDRPVSLYAATKKAVEVLAYSYSSLYQIPATGLRFFTVYGPWGRPDMAYFSFTEKLLRGEKIELYNYGECRRDFTYIDDIVEGVLRISAFPPTDPVPHAVYNIGNQDPVGLIDFVRILAEEMTRAGLLKEDYDLESHLLYVPAKPGDVVETFADCGPLKDAVGFEPSTGIRDGLRQFVTWYGEYVKTH